MVSVGLVERGPRGPASKEETGFFVLSEEATWWTPVSSGACVGMFPGPLATGLRWAFLETNLGKA